MNRKKFLGVAGGAVLVVTGGYYLQSDKSNFVRADLEGSFSEKIPLTADEKNILFLASLAPSGHNTQPWFVQYIEPYVLGSISALGAALASIGIPENSILEYETEIKAGKFMLLADGTEAELAKAREVLGVKARAMAI